MTFVDRQARALWAGAIALAVVTLAYPVFADATSRPLAVFALPVLLTAALGSWRSTALVGISSLAASVVVGVMGPLDTSALIARWGVIGAAVVMGAVGAAVREHQAGRLAELDETMSLLKAFELGLAPTPIPPEGFVAVGRYRPAESRMNIGGDFLEAIAMRDGRLAVLIGDVCGHGPRQAAFGAALRAGWKSIVLAGERDPADWIDALSTSFFLDGRYDSFVTMCTGYLDLQARVTCFVTAGHPAPVSLQRPPRLLDLPSSPALGLGMTGTWTATRQAWGGEPLLLYTDGLIENPRLEGPPRRWNEHGLLAWLDQSLTNSSPEALIDALLGAATAERDLRDDIALLIVAADPARGPERTELLPLIVEVEDDVVAGPAGSAPVQPAGRVTPGSSAWERDAPRTELPDVAPPKSNEET
jgi:Stage II sporulation protein E (SpoIIE)